MSNKKGEVATKGQFTQNDVPAMLEQVTAQLESLAGDTTKKPKTENVELPGFGLLNNIEDVQQLIKAHSSINAKEAGFKASVKELKLTLKLKPFTVNGIAPDVWKKDIAARISIVANKVQIAKLKKIKATLEENLSAEAKLANDLKAINDDMGEMSF
jgi:hypothetical protein